MSSILLLASILPAASTQASAPGGGYITFNDTPPALQRFILAGYSQDRGVARSPFFTRGIPVQQEAVRKVTGYRRDSPSALRRLELDGLGALASPALASAVASVEPSTCFEIAEIYDKQLAEARLVQQGIFSAGNNADAEVAKSVGLLRGMAVEADLLILHQLSVPQRERLTGYIKRYWAGGRGD